MTKPVRVASTLLAITFMVACGSQGCASLGSARHNSTRSYLLIHTTLKAISETEPQLVCGRATAPPAPLCVTTPIHTTINAKIEQAARIDQQAAGILRNMPVTAPLPAEVNTLLTAVSVLISESLDLIPDGSQAKAELVKLKEVR